MRKSDAKTLMMTGITLALLSPWFAKIITAVDKNSWMLSGIIFAVIGYLEMK